jgi:MscS family membrane protein
MERFKDMTKKFIAALLLALTLIWVPVEAKAGMAAATVKSAEELKEEGTTAPPIDTLGRSSPRGLVEGFLNALGKEDFDKASQYLDVSKYPEKQRVKKGAEQAKDLQKLLDTGGWLYPASMLSSAREGRADDWDTEELKSDVIGQIKSGGKNIDIRAEIKTDSDGNPIWLISESSLNEIPALLSKSTGSVPLINKALPGSLIETKWGGAPAGHWIAVIFLMVASYVTAWFLVSGASAIIKKYWTRRCSFSGVHVMDTLRLPLSLYAAVWIFGLSALALGFSIIVRQHVGQLNVVVAWTAIALFAWRLIDIVADATQKKIGSNGRFTGFSSILYFFRRFIKIGFGILVLFIVLDNFGVDVTAGLAALGIGGIALALGAQKTLENFIGSLAIVIDQPVHIGDYCKIGTVAGTVEDIGMRSTRLRTNDKTLVTIPNGDLSNQTIENYARRNRFLINKKFSLRYDTSTKQVREVMQKITEIMEKEETVDQGKIPVRFTGFSADGLVIEVFCYVNIPDADEFLRIQGDMMLKILDAVEQTGAYFAIPSQTFLTHGDGSAPVAA